MRCFRAPASAWWRFWNGSGTRWSARKTIACCGQPPFNSGYWDEARPVAAKVLEQLKDCRGGRHRLRFLRGDGQKVLSRTVCRIRRRRNWPKKLPRRTWEFSDFLVSKLGVTDLGARFPHTVTFHDGCHGLRELGIKKSPRTLLANVKGLQLVEMAEAETCCGFGGTFAAKFPMISTAMGEVKCAIRRRDRRGIHRVE